MPVLSLEIIGLFSGEPIRDDGESIELTFLLTCFRIFDALRLILLDSSLIDENLFG